MKSALNRLICGLLMLALASGCGRKTSGAHQDDDDQKQGGKKTGENAEAGGATFKEGRGLAFTSEMMGALGLKTAEADERPLAAATRLMAQVFAITPQVLASASVPEADAERFERQSVTGARFVRIDRATASATKRADAIFALEHTPPPQVGEFVELTFAAEARKVLSVPHSAILDAASGIFVYVVNGGNYLRTPVKLGARDADFVEIADGLYSGDIVVTTPVNQLWLAELRLTKGGEHSH